MMAKKTEKPIVKALSKLLKLNPQAGLVENRYRSLGFVINNHYQLQNYGLSSETIKAMIRDVVTLDRAMRKLTEGQETELKRRLAQEEMLDLDYTPLHHEDLKHNFDEENTTQ